MMTALVMAAVLNGAAPIRCTIGNLGTIWMAQPLCNVLIIEVQKIWAAKRERRPYAVTFGGCLDGLRKVVPNDLDRRNYCEALMNA